MLKGAVLGLTEKSEGCLTVLGVQGNFVFFFITLKPRVE